MSIAIWISTILAALGGFFISSLLQKRNRENRDKQYYNKLEDMNINHRKGQQEDEKKQVDKSEPILVTKGTMMNIHLNLGPLMDRAALLQPNVKVVDCIDGEGTYKTIAYKDLKSKAHQLAWALTKAGIKIGDNVGTLMYNNSRHLQIYHAVPSMGAVLTALNIRLHAKELGYIIKLSEMKLLFVDAAILPVLEKIPVKDRRSIKRVIICGDRMERGEWKCNLKMPVIDFEEFLETGNPTNFIWPNLHEDSGAFLCFTSGTTGNPKGVLYSHRSTILHIFLVNTSSDAFGLRGVDCVLTMPPMFHAAGWTLPLWGLATGGKLVLNGPFSKPNNIIQACLDHGVTWSAGVPTVWTIVKEVLSKDPKKKAMMTGVLRMIYCGGTAPPPSLIKWYKEEMNVNFHQLWGMSEMNPIGTVAPKVMFRRHLNLPDEQLNLNPTYAGWFVPLVDYKILNPGDHSKEQPHDGKSPGDLVVRGPTVTGSYYKVHAADKFHDGWLLTGDVGTIDKEERFALTDRSKDLVKSGGEWISSKDLENHIAGMSGVKSAAVVGVPHPKWDERPIVVIVEEDKADISLKDVRSFCQSRFQKWQLPDDLIKWVELPLTGTGKVSKVTIRKILEKESYIHPDQRV